MAHVKKNDKVYILSGADRGKTGIVIDILPKKGKVKVEGVNVVTRHYKPRREGEQGSIRKEERYIDISNVKKIE